MSDLNKVLNDRIARVARKQIRSQTSVGRKLTVQHRRDIAALKRVIASLQSRLAWVEKRSRGGAGTGPAAAASDGMKMRFRADGLRTHRRKLDLSAKDYGALIGVSGLTVYSWESGKSRPRRAQLEKLVTIRGLGKREALKRLEK